MDTTFFGKNLHKLVSQRNTFLFFSLILVIAVLFLTIAMFSKKERIIVVPTHGNSFWIEQEKVSELYIEKMGLFLSDLLLNRNAVDVEKKNQLVLEHVHPSFYHEIKKVLSEEGKRIGERDHVFYFRPEKYYVQGNQFICEGNFYVFVEKAGGTPMCAQKEQKKYSLSFQCENGRLLLTSLKAERS